MVVSPTGSGKTVFAAHIIQRGYEQGKHSLFMAHRREILDQTYGKLLLAGVDQSALGIIMAKDPRRNPAALVQVASVDTLRNRTKPPADIVFVDECHRAAAKTYTDIMEAYPSAYIIGLTATPWRADNKGFSPIFDDLVVVTTVQELIELGFLCCPRAFSAPDEFLPDLSGVRVSHGEYNERDLNKAVMDAKLVGDIPRHWAAKSAGRRTVVFASSVAHSRAIVDSFRGVGVERVEHLDGDMAPADRAAILARRDSGETMVVSSCNVLSEGWDQPSVKCAVLARPTKSLALHLQQVGRILRPWNDVEALILDHAKNCHEHGLPQFEREYALDPPARKRAKAIHGRTCPLPCLAFLPARTRVCPVCGHVFEDDERVGEAVPKTADADLVEYTIEARRKYWEDLCRRESENGYDEGWAFKQYVIKFKGPPPKEFHPKSVPREFSREEKDAYARHLKRRAESEGLSLRKILAIYRSKFNEDPAFHLISGAGRSVEVAPGQDATGEKERVEWLI